MARTDSQTITTQTSIKLCDVSTRPDGLNSPNRMRIYAYAVPSTGGWNGATATLYSSIDDGVTKIPEKDMFNTPVVFTHADGYFDLDVVSRTSQPGVQKPIQYYLTTTVANPTGIKAAIFDMN